MPKRSKTETDTLVTIAAGFFALHTRDAKEIASLLNTTERNVHRWAAREKWEEVLQTLDYEGERNFRVRPRRGSFTYTQKQANTIAKETQ